VLTLVLRDPWLWLSAIFVAARMRTTSGAAVLPAQGENAASAAGFTLEMASAFGGPDDLPLNVL